MTWLAWRQHRWDAASALGLLIVIGLGVVFLIAADSSLVADIARNCHANSAGVIPNACGSPPGTFSLTFQPDWWWLVVVGTVIPALVGMFVGAPMIAREVENSTYALIWTQGITRRRWFFSRLGVVALGAIISAAVLAGEAQGWFAMQRAVGSPLNLSAWDGFEIGAPVLIAYTLFALALGVAASAAIRRTVPAMAATLLGFVATRVTIALLARPQYVTPLVARATSTASQSGFSFGPDGPNSSSDWAVGPTVLSDSAGHPIPNVGFCVGSGPHCYAQLVAVQRYQPGDRFWLFQGIEALVFVALALALFALAYRLVMRIR